MNACIDLHLHSTASDGKDTPAGLWEKIKRLGIRQFSLTDHDTIDGVREMETLLTAEGSGAVQFIRGIEFSCITPIKKCHILGYQYDWDSPPFQALLEKTAALRRRKLEQRLDFLRTEYRIEFSPADVAAMKGMMSVGKPHLAELMVKLGVVNSAAEAIKNFIEKCPPLNDIRISAAEAIQAIRAANGIAVWAHPYGGAGERPITEEAFQSQLALLTDLGIHGLECYYSQYTGDQIASLIGHAEERDLAISGGSDYHGRPTCPSPGTLRGDGNPVAAKQLSITRLLAKER